MVGSGDMQAKFWHVVGKDERYGWWKFEGSEREEMNAEANSSSVRLLTGYSRDVGIEAMTSFSLIGPLSANMPPSRNTREGCVYAPFCFAQASSFWTSEGEEGEAAGGAGGEENVVVGRERRRRITRRWRREGMLYLPLGQMGNRSTLVGEL